MTIYRKITQLSPEWFALRRGRLCSSEIASVIDGDGMLRMARKKDAGYADSVHTLVSKIIAERISGYSDAGMDFRSGAMQYGNDHEVAALGALALFTGLDFERVGGIASDCGQVWASTDGVAMDGAAVDAVAEIKIPLPKTQVGYLRFPDEFVQTYKPQLAVEIIASKARRGFLFAYGPGLDVADPNLLIEVKATDPFVACVRIAIEELKAIVSKELERIGADSRPLPAPPREATWEDTLKAICAPAWGS